ncbi:VOC family protein [Lysobacter korlensis]|uniref:VOC family protein n=1 Tax=Lysobacter korlensis TaxID=553636 RepID=A0ABV6RZ81_9GAMM
MPAPVPYLHFDGVAADALRFYHEVFGGDLELNTFADFGRNDGPGDAIAHGTLSGPVDLYGADIAGDGRPVRMEGMMLSLLGAAAPDVLDGWFAALAVGGRVIDPLQERPWGDSDGTLCDRFGLTWLVGYKGDAARG